MRARGTPQPKGSSQRLLQQFSSVLQRSGSILSLCTLLLAKGQDRHASQINLLLWNNGVLLLVVQIYTKALNKDTGCHNLLGININAQAFASFISLLMKI